MGRTIRGRSPITTVETYNTYSFRSDFMIPEVKHCFEATFVSGCKGFHAGFSPSKTERTFVSYWGLSLNNAPSFAERDSTKNNAYSNGLTINKGDIVMMCLDTENSLVTAKINNKERNLTFSIQSTKTWYAYIDAGSNCGSTNRTTVKVNLGKKKFNNKIPKGYAPFIYGFYDIINDIRCTNSKNHISQLLHCLVIFILLSS